MEKLKVKREKFSLINEEMIEQDYYGRFHFGPAEKAQFV